MGSSDTGVGVLDCSVGSIVWVRRRNGSWWPGKIVGPEELSASYATSPRSGTPVKLLGREDASVDWYNLEKSKRVKAFRCGEFDDCIGRAEAAIGMPPKKREKYARREDAIMHALELERQLIEKSPGNLEKSSPARIKVSKDADSSSVYMGNGVGEKSHNIFDAPCETVASSLFEKNETNMHLCGAKSRDVKQVSVDDSADMLPRMRGLKEFGLHTAPSTAEQLSGVAPHAKKRKYSHLHYYTPEYENVHQMLSSPMEIQVLKEDSNYPDDLDQDQASGSAEDTETDCSETDSSESDPHGDLAALSDGSASVKLHPKYPKRIEGLDDHGSISSSDDIDGPAHSSRLYHPFQWDPAASGSEVLKSNLNGKKESHNLSKRVLYSFDSESSRWCAQVGSSSGRSSSKKLFNSLDIADLGSSPRYSESAKRGYWKDCQEYVNPFFLGKHPADGRVMLVDVEVQVNRNNYRRNAPIVSLTSKLNGHAIIGHPLQVETLESGSTANILSIHCPSPEQLESPALASVWRTGRRTANFRVPRPFLLVGLEGDAKLKPRSIKQGAPQSPFPSDHAGTHRISSKSYLQSATDKRHSRSSSKVSPSSNLKIRSLSAITAEGEEHHQVDSKSSPAIFEDDNRLMKAVGATVVACIPVNLVFTRLHEELLGRHP